MDNVQKHNICIKYTGTQTDLLGMGFHISTTDVKITRMGWAHKELTMKETVQVFYVVFCSWI
jgi:hypothetical protein